MLTAEDGRSMDAASYSIDKHNFFFLISDSAVFSYWSPSDTACLTAGEQLEQELTELRDILSLAPAVKHITGVHGCVIAPWKTWAERGTWTERPAVLSREEGIRWEFSLRISPFRQGIACFRSQGKIFPVFYQHDEQQQNKQRTHDATRPERCHCNHVWELKRARVRSRRVQWRCGIMIAEIVAVTLLYGNDSSFT